MTTRHSERKRLETLFCPACGRETLAEDQNEGKTLQPDDTLGCTLCKASILARQETRIKDKNLDLGCCSSDKDCWCS